MNIKLSIRSLQGNWYDLCHMREEQEPCIDGKNNAARYAGRPRGHKAHISILFYCQDFLGVGGMSNSEADAEDTTTLLFCMSLHPAQNMTKFKCLQLA